MENMNMVVDLRVAKMEYRAHVLFNTGFKGLMKMNHTYKLGIAPSRMASQ